MHLIINSQKQIIRKEERVQKISNDNLNILDVGSYDGAGNYNYSDIFDEKNWNYTGLDIQEGNNVDIVVTDIYNWFEINDNIYDVIISGQFFEHLEYFWLTMSQIERVLKPGGYVCIIVPSAGGNYNEDMPNCYKIGADGLKALAEYVGLDIIRVSVDGRSIAEPWHDAYLFAQKSEKVDYGADENLEARIKDLEDKMNSLLNKSQ